MHYRVKQYDFSNKSTIFRKKKLMQPISSSRNIIFEINGYNWFQV